MPKSKKMVREYVKTDPCRAVFRGTDHVPAKALHRQADVASGANDDAAIYDARFDFSSV